MEQQLILEMLEQSRSNTAMVLCRLNSENATFRLNTQSASASFIARHIGETMNLLMKFLDIPTDIKNTTMGFKDEGQGLAYTESLEMVEYGYEKLRKYVAETPEGSWTEVVETPFFGKLSKMRLFTHVLMHNSYHVGQVALTIAKGAPASIE